MCQEIHLCDVRLALCDYCEENDEDEEHPRPDDLLALFDDSLDDDSGHAFDHNRRANELASAGDDAGASIHRALLANMVRAAG